MCDAVNPNTPHSGPLTPHGTVGAVSGGSGTTGTYRLLVSKVKKKRTLNRRTRACVCVCVSRSLRVTSAAVSKTRPNSQRHVLQSWPVPGPHKQTDANVKGSEATSLMQHVFRETMKHRF